MRPILTFLLSFIISGSYSQTITGSVKDAEGRPFRTTTVSLLKAADSATIKLAISKEDGSYSFPVIKEGTYRIHVSHVGYAAAYSAPFAVAVTGDVTVPALILQKSMADMKAVTVTASKPLIEIKADKTILNVEGTINAAGSDVLELLRKSPGVMVDKDDNLLMSGKNGVQVYIDGRPSPLSGQDLSRYLKSLQSSQVESIQLIANPSAKYDAAGNAGIINIVLKKNKSLGTNGSVNGGYNISTHARYNGALSINHRNKKVNIFSNYGYSGGTMASTQNIYRTIPDSLFDQKGKAAIDMQSHNIKAGIDFFPNGKTTIGAIVSGNFSTYGINTDSRTPISQQSTGNINRILVAGNNNDRNANNMNFNLNYNRTYTKSRALSLNADYAFHHINSDQLQPNTYYDPTYQHKISEVTTRIMSPSAINIYSFKADWEQLLGKGKLEMGGKTGYVNTSNDFQQYNVLPAGSIKDNDRSNRFQYKENINAVYVNYSRGWKGFMVQAGLRAENTNLEGSSHALKNEGTGYSVYDTVFKRHYTDLFPSAAITFNKKPLSQFSLTYSRRIDRPSYKDLNPFEFKLDEYMFERGNVNLRPQYTHSFGLTHSWKYKLTTTLNYSIVRDMFTVLVDTTEKSKAFSSKKNLASQQIASLTISYMLRYKTYMGIFNVNSNYSRYKANIEGRAINRNAVGFSAFTQNSLTFKKTWTAELTSFYYAPMLYAGTTKIKGIWSMDAGIQKKIMKGNATIKAAVSDIFHTLKYSTTTDFAGQKTVSFVNFESRQFKLNFVYRFGNNQVKTARQRATGSEEENKRAQGGGTAGPGIQQ